LASEPPEPKQHPGAFASEF
jgi:transcription elongation factor SPT6